MAEIYTPVTNNEIGVMPRFVTITANCNTCRDL